MKAQSSVLFDAPGPKTRRNILLGNIAGAVIIAAIIVWILLGLAEKGQLTEAKWQPFTTSDAWQYYLLPGLLQTLRAAAVAIVTSLAFGILFGLGRLAANRVIRWVCSVIVEFFRAVPVLLMMIFIYQVVSRSGVLPQGESSFYAVVVALTLYNGSVIAELVRSGVHGLPKGQREAALAIGMTRPQSLRSVELPQALLAMLPSLISQFVVILKDSALGYIIGFGELLRSSRLLGSADGNILPALLVAAAIFIVINFALSSAAQKASTYLGHRGTKTREKAGEDQQGTIV